MEASCKTVHRDSGMMCLLYCEGRSNRVAVSALFLSHKAARVRLAGSGSANSALEWAELNIGSWVLDLSRTPDPLHIQGSLWPTVAVAVVTMSI